MGAVGPRARRRHEFKAGTPIVEVVDDGRGVRRCCGVAAGSSRLKRWASGSSRRRHAGEGGGDGQGRRARSSRGPTTCPSASCGRCLSKLTLARYLGERARDHSRADSSRRRSRGARARARAEGRIRRLQEARGGMVRTRGRDDLGRGRHLSSLRGAAHRALLGLGLDLRALWHRQLLRGGAAELADDDGEDEDEDGRADAETDDERRGALNSVVALFSPPVVFFRVPARPGEGVLAGAALRRTC